MNNEKAMTFRLSEKLAEDLAAIARTDEVSISEAVREAIEGHIASRRSDAAFQKRLEKRIEEDRKLMERLAGDA